MTDDIYIKLAEHWRKINYPIRQAPVSEGRITDLEDKYDIKLPTDFRKYLMEASPEPHGGEMDDSGASWWSLKRINSILEECGPDWTNLKLDGDGRKYLIFGDHFIWCWAWAICCEAGTKYGAIFHLGDGAKVADSFTDFVDNYIRDYPNFHGVPNQPYFERHGPAK